MHICTQYILQEHTLATLRAAQTLLGDGQCAWRAGGTGKQITSHLGITAFTLPAATISPSSQVLKYKEWKGTGEKNIRKLIKKKKKFQMQWTKPKQSKLSELSLFPRPGSQRTSKTDEHHHLDSTAGLLPPSKTTCAKDSNL